MSTDEHESLPSAWTPKQPDPVVSAGMKLAAQWGSVLEPEMLRVAMVALEPQLKREHALELKKHEIALKKLENERAAAEQLAAEKMAAAEQLAADKAAAAEQLAADSKAGAEQVAADKREERRLRRHQMDLIAGTGVAIAMLGAGVYVAKDSWWLAGLLFGPSLLALAKIIILRRSDPDDMKHVAQSVRALTEPASRARRRPYSSPE